MITVKLASIPSREQHLATIIENQLPYADKFEVYLNNYENIPLFLKNKKIKVFTSQQFGDRKDCGKFFNVEMLRGYVIFFDDDLIYPSDYIAEMIKKIDQYKRASLICVHGNLLPPNPIKSYYKEKKGLLFSNELLLDTLVDIPGTGTLGIHSDFVKIPYNIFKSYNMTDLWMGLFALQMNIPIQCIAREAGWLQEVSFDSPEPSIRQRYYKNDSLQTEIANTMILQKQSHGFLSKY